MNIEPYLVKLRDQEKQFTENEEMMGNMTARLVEILLAFKQKSEMLNNKLLLLEQRIKKCMEKGKPKSKDLVETLRQQFQQVEYLNEMIDELENGRIEPEEMSQYASEAIVQLQNQLEELQSKVIENEAKLGIKKQEFDNDMKRKKQLEVEIKELEGRIYDLSDEIVNVDDENERAKEEISKRIIDLASNFLSLLSKIQDEETKMFPKEVAQQQLKKIQDQMNNLKREKEISLQELYELEQIYKANRNDLDEIKRQIQEIKKEIGVQDEKLTILLEQKSQLENLQKKLAPTPIGKEKLEEQYIAMSEIGRKIQQLNLNDEVQKKVSEIIDEALETRVKDVVDKIMKEIQGAYNLHIQQMKIQIEEMQQMVNEPDTFSLGQMSDKVDELLKMTEDCEKTTEQLDKMVRYSDQETIEQLKLALITCKQEYIDLLESGYELPEDYSTLLDENDYNQVKDKCDKIERIHMGMRLEKLKK